MWVFEVISSNFLLHAFFEQRKKISHLRPSTMVSVYFSLGFYVITAFSKRMANLKNASETSKHKTEWKTFTHVSS